MEKETFTTRQLLEQNIQILADILPENYPIKRFISMFVAECNKLSNLHQCPTKSIIACALQLAKLQLEPGAGNYCGLTVKYNKKTSSYVCDVFITYRGLIDLYSKHGNLKTISAHTVDAADEFKFNFGLKPNIYHVPNPEKTNNLIYAYAIITLIDNTKQFDVMHKSETDAIKKLAPYSHVWDAHESEMMKKTVLRRLLKVIPFTNKEIVHTIEKLESSSFNEDFVDEIQTTSSTGTTKLIEGLVNKSTNK
jgi:recombination protein RecT